MTRTIIIYVVEGKKSQDRFATADTIRTTICTKNFDLKFVLLFTVVTDLITSAAITFAKTYNGWC